MSSGKDLQVQFWHLQLHVLLRSPLGLILLQAVQSSGGGTIPRGGGTIPRGGDPHCRQSVHQVFPAVHVLIANNFVEFSSAAHFKGEIL